MSRRLVILDVVFGLVSLALALGVVRTLVVTRPLPLPASVPARPATPTSIAAPSAPAAPEDYAPIVAQNPFNPGRSGTATAAPADFFKPILHGIVIDGTTRRAFLEDPVARCVGGYSLGDVVVGGTVSRIADDRVVIARPEGLVEVLLQDPSKPRSTPATQGAPAATPVVRQDTSTSSRPAVVDPRPPGNFAPGQTAPLQVAASPMPAPPPEPSPSQLPQLRRRPRAGGND